MRIALVGYGKMGKAIESICLKKGHQVSYRIDVANAHQLQEIHPDNTDAAIEFSHPTSALSNVKKLIEQGIPTVCGTTGWLEHLGEVKSLVSLKKGSFLYASNFSVGVNIFFALNERLSQLMNAHAEYDVTMEETHHVYKKDAPSGTAITLAEGLLHHLDRKKGWTIDRGSLTPELLYIEAIRSHHVPGTHTVNYTSAIDSIEIKHTAFNREGFATGAVLSAEYIFGKTGIFSIKDVLNLN